MSLKSKSKGQKITNEIRRQRRVQNQLDKFEIERTGDSDLPAMVGHGRQRERNRLRLNTPRPA